MHNKLRVLVTGASRGIGKAIAKRLNQIGYQVIGTSRDPKNINPDDKIEGVEYLELNLAEKSSIDRLVNLVGEIDVLINNAGISQLGPVEEIPIERIRNLFEINLFGVIRLIQGFLPGMRQRGSGTIINISSMAALTPVPFSSIYASSKAALDAFTKGLRGEVMKYGIKAVVISPFHIKTDIAQEVSIGKNSVYTETMQRVKAVRDRGIQEAPPPEVVADKVVQVLARKHPKHFYAVGHRAGLMEFLIRRLPQRMVENLTLKRFKI